MNTIITYRSAPLSRAFFKLVLNIIAFVALCTLPATGRGEIFLVNQSGGGTSGNSTIGKYTTAGETANASLVALGVQYSQDLKVSGIDVYVANPSDGTIGKYTTAGATVNAALITGLQNPTGLAVSGTDLYVVSNGSVGKYTTGGATVDAQFITGGNAMGIAVSGGKLFVTNYLSNTIGEYDAATGAPLQVSLVTGLQNPWGIAVSGGNIFVVNSGNHGRIGQYTTSGATVNASLITLPYPIFIAVSGTNLFVSYGINGAVGKFTTSGATLNATLLTSPEVRVPIGIDVVPDAPKLTGAVSRKAHGGAGTFDINLLLVGSPGIECRSSGGNHTVVFAFNNNIVSGDADVSAGTGMVLGTGFGNNAMIVTLTGVSDVQKITVNLSNVTDEFAQVMPNTAVNMNMLVGDVNGNKTVNSTDVSETKLQSGQPVTAANLREDIIPNGQINGSDVSQAKLRVGSGVP